MGYSQLCLLLLLSSYTLAQDSSDNNEQTSTCLLASRFKAYKKYVYQYTTESRNGVVGTANLRNGPKVSCQVEIEVPQICRFIMHTRGCVLSEVSVMDPQGQPVYKQSPGSDAFQAAMEKNALKFSVEEVTDVQLYPENDEPVNILNIKRGIISALTVPILEDEQSSFMSTVHGQCLTDYVENARRDIATDVTLSRDLSQCDQFYSRKLSNSPLALLQKLHSPMSKLITSTQNCNYQFDNRGRHITTAMCTEQHIYLPFSHVDNGISSVLTQDLSFQSSKRINNRVFDVNPSQSKPLHFEDPEDKAPVQTKDAVLNTLRDLAALPGTDQGQKRTSLFHKLVSSLRVLRNETLSQTVPEMREISGWLTWQALIQCGTAECTSAILQVIRTIDGVSLEVDALVYGLSLQANPDAARVRDMLSMAQYKQSKAIMYALANTVKKFHEGAVTPVVTDVSKFMETLLNDCSLEIQDYDSDFPPDPAESSFLVLRVVGVMGQAMQAASPDLISSILRCAQKTDISLSNQKAAIQAFRLMDINDEIRNVLMEAYQDAQSPVEKRLAAYLILMKNPDYTLVSDVVKSLDNERNEQLRSFVISHLNNIRNSDEPQMHQLREYIDLALKDKLSPPNKVFDGMSRNYKINSPLGSIQSNIIFDDGDTLPKEMMLETTLKAFDYNYDIFEVSVEGSGFEPTIDALFGEKGFFPESISRALYMAGDTAQMLKDILDRTVPQQDRKKRQAPQDHLKAITESFQRLMNDLRFSPTPEATAYLRLLGNEIGYMKTSEMRKMAETLFMYFQIFIRILPGSAFIALTSNTENEVFAHYIFMENAFALPTASGFPLKFSLAGVFAPGAKGGLVPSAMTDLSFMPSVGLEFITQMGVHIPDYVDAGIEMHTNMYHESSLNAKVSINKNQIKLSIPAPTSNTQLFSISNKLLSVSSGQTKIVPSLVEDRTDSTDCQPLFTGLNLCTILRYSNATSTDQAPYYPLTGETKFAMEIQPTGKVSEYTATITDETLREGKKGRHKVETLKLTLRAEGEDSVEATAALKYNRNKNTLSTEVVIPDYDVEAGIKLAVTNGDTDGTKMRGITIDVTNKNIPQLTLVGRTRLNMMRDAMLQLEMGIPSLKADASVTANLKKDEDVLLDLETVVHLSETSYQHKTSLKYDNDKFEVEVKTDLNSDVQKMIPNLEDHHRKFQQLIDDILDQRVTKTDMKLRHIVTKGIEAGNIWLDKLTASMPYLANLRSKRSISDLTLPSPPDKLFLQSDSLFRYQFNKDKLAISVPLPHGGKKSEELNIPKTLSTPVIDLPEIGLYIPANNYPLPSFTIPPSLDFTVPLLGLAEASTKINSNFYSWEGSISGGNNTVDDPSYVAQYKAIGQSPFNLLSYKLEGAAMMSGRADDNLKYLLNSSFSHILVDTSLSILETLRVSNKLNARANYKFEASSPVGLQASLYYSAQSTSTLDSDEVSGDGTVDGLLKIGSFYTNTSYTQSYNLRPRDQEGRGESTLHFDSPILKFQNMIRGVYANSELNIMSKTSAQKDMFKHIAELKYKDAQLILKCNAVATPMGKSLNNKVELGVSSQMALIRIESQADDDTKRAYSLITGSLDSNGLELNSEGSLIFNTGRGLHKATVRIGRSGLTTSGTNSIQCSPVTLENIYSCAIDNNGASMDSTTKVMADEGRGELIIKSKITGAEASMYGDLTGHAYDVATTNNMNIVLNRGTLTLTGNTKGTFKQMKTENSHTLTLTLWTVKLHSNTNNFICEDIYYKQGTKADIKPFVLKFDMTNDLKFYDVSLNNEGHIRLEPIKVDLSGSTTGAYREEHNVKHAYELSYDNMAGTLKCSTSGNIMEAQLSHNCELEFAGLSSTSNCEARINSEPLRFDGKIHTMALPFSLTIDALVNSDGEINLHGKHTGQLYSKLLVKAEPLALAYSHDSRVSTTHKPRRREFSTNLDNKCEGLLTPNEQYLTWNVKSKLNDHAYNQDISTYNNPEKAGFEFSGVMSTDVFSRYKRSVPETQEFSMTGFIKYDKNSDCHIIEIPFIESLPAAFEKLKNTLAQALESLQQFIRNLDINQLIIDFRAKLDEIPVQVSDFMREMDLENKVDQVKVKLDYLINEFAVTMEDLELAMNNLRENLEYSVTDISTKIRDLILKIEEYVNSGQLADDITNVLSRIGNGLQDFDEKYSIKQSFVKVLDVIEDIVRQINLQKLKDSSAAFLRELDSKYGILETIKDKLSDLKQAIDNFDINMFLQDVKDYLLSIDWAAYLEQLSYKIPSSRVKKVLESMNDVIVNWIDEYEIPNKLNAVYSYFKDLLLKYDLDDIFKDLMDQAVTLVKEFKIEETVQTGVEALKSIKFEFVYNKVMEFLHSLTSQLKATDFKKSIDDLNEHISLMLKSMKEFDYNAFVDETNRKMAELTEYINEQIKTYEIVEKIEAVRDFFREIQSSIVTYLDELKNTKVADALKKLKRVIDTTFYNDIKLKALDILDDIKQRISDMDVRDEIYVYLQRASESYRNIVAYISAQFDRLMEKIREVAKNNDVINQIKQAVDGVLDRLKSAEIEVHTFTVPLTDLVIPAFTINLNKLQDISIPSQISLPEFTILNSYTVPAIIIDFDEIKARIVAVIDDMKEFEIQTPDPEDIFGDLKVLYLSELPDLTFPEITLSEIKFPAINIPKLSLNNFEITMLPIPEIKFPGVPSDVCIPVFGKLHGEFNINAPQYSLETTWKLENSTTTLKNPQFTATITSQAKSPIEPLEYTFEATAQLEAPRMKKLLFSETMKANHMAFSIDHEGSLTLTGSSAEASAKTTTKATTPVYTADLINIMAFTLRNGIYANTDTTYNHNLDIPSIETSSQASMQQIIAATMDSGKISVNSETTCNGKWSIQDYSDEGTHKSNAEFNVDFNTAKLTFAGETDCKAVKAKQTLTAESVILSHITVEARCEAEVPSVKKSVTVLHGEAHIGDLKVALTASHDAEFTGNLIGSMSNSLEFMTHPFEIVLDVKNKLNSKIFFPLKLTGKVDLQHDYGVVLNSEKQCACWFALARFNQYKYGHNFTAENNEMDILLLSSASGEANLDFLTVPLSFPEIKIPYVEIQTPEVIDFSLWENAGFKTLLTTPQQSFDMNLKLQYQKNPDTHKFELYLEPIYSVISDNANIIQRQFEECRDKVVTLLKDSYNQAKSQYIKHKIDTSGMPPRIFRVPGYKIPVLNIEVSAFRAEMPAFSYFVPKEVSTPRFKIPALGFSVPSYTLVLPSLRFPVIHVPDNLSEIKLPTFTLPDIQNNVVIPAMGNITFDFSFKSPVITISTNAGLYNQFDIVARFSTFSSSVFDILNVKIDGTTSLTKKRGLKLATTVSLEHNNIEANHECAVSLNKRSMEASVANNAKISLPFLNLELNHELTGNTKTKPNVSSKKNIKYMLNIPLIESVGKGNLEMIWDLEALSSDVSVETSTKGKSDITVMDIWNFAGDLENGATFYLNANGLRTTVTTALNSNINKQAKQKRSSNNNIFMFYLNKNLALEVSLRRMFATIDYTSTNNVDFASVSTTGKHNLKGELDFVPLTTLKTALNIDANQPSSLGNVEVTQSIKLAISSEKQSFTWSGKEQLASLIHVCDLLMSNDESNVRMDLTGSVEGHLAFLKSVKLPVYQKTLWDVLKFDQVTNIDKLQILQISSSIVYTKSMDGYVYTIPSTLLQNGVMFNVPEINIALPSWVKSIPELISKVDMRFENTDVPDHITLPPEIKFPAFDVPFTTLHVEPFGIDPKNLHIPKVITTKEFEIMLPGLPIISVPSYSINTEYLQEKMSFLLIKLPQYEVTVSSFTLPKSFTVGEHTFSLNDITNQITNFELPTIVIPEQKIEIPEMALHLPSSLFIPAFGALGATLKVSSPIYNVTTTVNLEKQGSDLITSLNSLCTSTMSFLEYDLSATATIRYENRVINLNGKCNLIHNDVNVNWQHILAQNLRMKRQTSLTDVMESRHTLNVDIISRTFVDGNFRFASRKDGVTASISSPSSGFLGLQFQRRSPSQLYGKLFGRYLSSPEKDIDVLTAKASLKNSNKLVFQMSWNWEFFHDVIEGTKYRIPAMTNAVLKFINKYHFDHFGFNIQRAGMKMKNTVSNVIERGYHEVSMSFDTLQDLVFSLADQGKNMYRKASDGLMSMNVQDAIDRLVHEAREVMKLIEDKMNVLLDEITQFLRDRKHSVPRWEGPLIIQEIFQEARLSVSRVTDRVIQRFSSLTVKISTYIREVEFTLPGIDVVVNGNEILDKLESVFSKLRHPISRQLSVIHNRVTHLFQVILEKAEDFITYLKDKNVDISSEVDAIHAKIVQSSKQRIEEARRHVAEYKDLLKMRIEEVHGALTMERVYTGTEKLIVTLQIHLYEGLHEGADLMRRASQSTAPYITVSNKKADIEIPLPFLWKSFNDWPKQFRQ
ncbi:apolipoprotein B-100 isoform X1 [Acanthochromis polyacanthus]|uniref:apolipoprotein B-100 isoform X1 n=1 Tax=Acanthochromis polyacanthus TaxID=80966 RepID=UPI002233EBA1|nr:apolipoprotein B-100 isoform X1 [Acanthochromis polyacanthus]